MAIRRNLKKVLQNTNMYYDIGPTLATKARYHIIFGERSNGKTYACLYKALERYFEDGSTFALIRRWQEDIGKKNGDQMFAGLVANGVVSLLSGGEWTDIYYYSRRFYLCKFVDGRRVTDEKPIGFAFALTVMEHDKSSSYPNVKTIIYDEFITRGSYLPNEFELFTNTLSTIIRQNDDVEIFMCGNTVNKYCPYFANMGLKHIKEMSPGDIDVYEYGDTGLTVSVEYCKPYNKGKKSDVYFAFDSPKMKMITSGEWELDVYPHKPEPFSPKDILFTFFIVFDDQMLQCEVIDGVDAPFLFVHMKTTELKYPDLDLIYSQDYDSRPNWRRNILKPMLPVERKISALIRADKVFYQDNETGDIWTNYLNWCKVS